MLSTFADVWNFDWWYVKMLLHSVQETVITYCHKKFVILCPFITWSFVFICPAMHVYIGVIFVHLICRIFDMRGVLLRSDGYELCLEMYV